MGMARNTAREAEVEGRARWRVEMRARQGERGGAGMRGRRRGQGARPPPGSPGPGPRGPSCKDEVTALPGGDGLYFLLKASPQLSLSRARLRKGDAV